MGSLSQEDITCLCEEWIKSYKDIMQGALDELPLLQEVNHHIPLIDKKKRYKYHPPRCLDSLKPKLMEKIACYMHAGWWEPAQVEQVALMLCIKEKTNKLRTVIDG